jgi:hypothetical protein
MRNGIFRMLSIGDSVVWGQGLLDEHKFRNIVATHLPAAPGAPETACLAHSGAVIGVGLPPNPNPPKAACQGQQAGEVPDDYPTIMEQVAAFQDSPETIDLILMNGGINDVSIQVILDPLTDTAHLQALIELHCHQHMAVLLGQVAAKFPSAQVALTGYYPILSDQSDPNLFKLILAAHGVPILDALVGLENDVRQKIVKDCAIFSDQSATAMQKAVQEINSSAANRVIFVASGFGPENSAFAPNKWVFGLNDDLSPQDEVIDIRQRECDTCEDDILLLFICDRASAGHPNVSGAQQYASQIIAGLKAAGLPLV